MTTEMNEENKSLMSALQSGIQTCTIIYLKIFFKLLMQSDISLTFGPSLMINVYKNLNDP